MRKVNLLRQAVARDPEMQELFSALCAQRRTLAQAYANFDNAVEPELVEACVYEINAALSRYDYLLRAIKERGGSAAAKLYTEGTVTWV